MLCFAHSSKYFSYRDGLILFCIIVKHFFSLNTGQSWNQSQPFFHGSSSRKNRASPAPQHCIREPLSVSLLSVLCPFLMSLVPCLKSPVSRFLSHASSLLSHIFCLLSHIFCLLSHASSLLSPVSHLLSPVSHLMSHCLKSPFSRLLSLSHLSCLTTSVSCRKYIVSCLMTPCLLSYFSSLFHISYLMSPVLHLLSVSCHLSVSCLLPM